MYIGHDISNSFSRKLIEANKVPINNINNDNAIIVQQTDAQYTNQTTPERTLTKISCNQ